MTRCPVLLPDDLAPPSTLARAAAWYREVSGGAARLELEVIPVDAGDAAWAELSGAARWPADAPHARAAVHALVAGLPEALRSRIGGSVLVVVGGDRPHPHTWRFRDGGVHLGQRRWCRRYALVPSTAPLGALAHELGHLLFGWPDLATQRIGVDCLMATGALVDDDRPPAWPCAPLRVAAGWAMPHPVRAGTRVGDLRPGAVGEFDGLLIERRDDRLVAFSPLPPRLVARVTGPDPERPVLAVLADAAGTSGHGWETRGRTAAPPST